MISMLACSRRSGKYAVVSGDYIWKYTHNGYDFSVLGATPIYLSDWVAQLQDSWICCSCERTGVPRILGLVVFSSVAARFFPPQIGGAGRYRRWPRAGSTPFRIDHDEKFNQTTHLQYQPWKQGPWVGFNWRYDSGLVAGQTPCFGWQLRTRRSTARRHKLPSN